MATQGVLGAATLKEFEEGLHGSLVQPGDASYDEARAIWNGVHDGRPAVIARCADAADVRHAVGFARSEGLDVAVRGGGHSIPGFSTCDDGIVIDLSPMKGIEVDAAGRTATAAGGVLWNEFDAATQEHGLATTGGLVSTTGIAGFTLGGGIGWLMRKHGLACDNLRSAEVVTADGQILTASATENSDLFWGLRGGGGNFGIVTSFEFDLHPVGPTVAAGPVFYPGERAEEVMRFYRDYVQDLPDEATTLVNLLTAPPAPFLPEEWHGKKLVALIGCYSGDPEEGMKALQPLRDLGDPVADLIGPMPYVQMQGLIDALWPQGTKAYMKAGYLRELDDHAIETMARFHLDATSPASEIHIQHFAGAIARVDGEATAYGERQAPFVLNAIASSHEPGELDPHVEWAQRLYAEIEPSLTGGAYINFLSAEGGERVQAAYGAEKFARLRALKDRYDPTNLFHLNQNIPPSSGA
ncbi:MAG TPA: FAD-binding oxidoreductase [Solirubrobacterales bacterium]|nr:FAD-binding oxidoreductase [Solirubrobacterales bacterium]